MKSITKYSLSLLLFLSQGCSNAPAGIDTAITILIDRTDPLQAYPEADDISDCLGLKQDPWQGIQMTVTSISDKDVNDTRIVTLEKEDRWTGSITVRKARIARFTKELRAALIQAKSQVSLDHSIIYRSIAKYLNALAATNAAKKHLLVYSDLMENDVLNFYAPKTFSLLQTKPDNVRRGLENIAPIQDSKGVDVWLLYEPVTYEANHTYRIAAGFYKQLLESKGAIAHIEKSFNP
jgi:hypothetical protein